MTDIPLPYPIIFLIQLIELRVVAFHDSAVSTIILQYFISYTVRPADAVTYDSGLVASIAEGELHARAMAIRKMKKL